MTRIEFDLSQVCVIIPAFNEEKTLAEVVASCLRDLPNACVVVVDDGSEDRTAEVGRLAGARVIELPVNLGIGGAVQTGYRFALRNGFKYAVQVDGDGQHDPAEVGKLLQVLNSDGADLAIGSRWLGRGDYQAPKDRRIGMRILSKLVSWRVGSRFTDTTSGFRAVNKKGIELFSKSYPRDFPEVETIVMAHANGLVAQEVPVKMYERSHGNSSIGGLQSIYYMALESTMIVVGAISNKASK
jgi:glycosyltransferase involved in cell wall biosynthesis